MQFAEVRVYEGIAERTGVVVDRATVRGISTVCRSMAELTRKVRQHGDGNFYVAVNAWPPDIVQIPLFDAWIPMS
jgi:hypothetical protein